MAGNGVQFNPQEYKFPKEFGWNVGGSSRVTPQPTTPARIDTQTGISLPPVYSYTYSEDGNTPIVVGNDGPGTKHISDSEKAYMQQYKGLARNILTLA